MRKITQEAAQALLNGETYRNNNTHVEGGVMLLHGNAIARYDRHTLIVSNAGWHTTTTNCIIHQLSAILQREVGCLEDEFSLANPGGRP